MKIKGLDKLQKTLKKAAWAAADADGDIGTVQFDPNDPASIAQAITSMEAMVDAKFDGSENNLLIRQMADALKEKSREAILERAAAARLKGSA
ncbi:hypothetical protein [Parvibaculum sp.]|uniref:hypothetical protein n=1 Tax=Parvibaculum sp. TaxID=2024848 RepID=UPI001D5F087C|nr:hypothetical protein [Parvibaculum sp.]MBX3490502.1 hypothetical protein [Parvibaculum sp.]